MTTVLAVMAIAATATGSGFGQLASAQHNTIRQLAVYSLIATVTLWGLGVIMLVGLSEFRFTSFHPRRGRVTEAGAISWMFWTGVVCTLLAVFLPHWIGVPDGWGRWLQPPLNPD